MYVSALRRFAKSHISFKPGKIPPLDRKVTRQLPGKRRAGTFSGGYRSSL